MTNSSSSHPSCSICAGARRDAIARSEHWSIRAHAAPCPVAGWHIVDLARHAESWDELRTDESASLGPFLSRATRAIRSATGCERVYLLSFCEAVPHLHLHLAPRHAGDESTNAWSVADLYRRVQRGEAPSADPSRAAEISALVARELESGDDSGVASWRWRDECGKEGEAGGS
ncbi:MAG: diadenosine tetraphosphate hydrolase [Phycisphaerae bacterium]|nr:diadenosine tetraphosphate hydrolase [Phycisphaerae bacterium]